MECGIIVPCGIIVKYTGIEALFSKIKMFCLRIHCSITLVGLTKISWRIVEIWHGKSKSHSLNNQNCKDLAAGAMLFL